MVVRRYAIYQGKPPDSMKGINLSEIANIIEKLVVVKLSLENISIEDDVCPLAKVVVENKQRLNKLFQKVSKYRNVSNSIRETANIQKNYIHIISYS